MRFRSFQKMLGEELCRCWCHRSFPVSCQIHDSVGLFQLPKGDCLPAAWLILHAVARCVSCNMQLRSENVQHFHTTHGTFISPG